MASFTDGDANTGAPTGLSSADAAERLRQDGFNELPSKSRRNFFDIALQVAAEPMILLLLVSAGIYWLLGESPEAIILSGSILFICFITIVQERKTERALTALRDLSSPRACVIRDGQEWRIAGREVVRDDLLVLTEGDRVPADASVISCNDLVVDESLLTGESMPVRKLAGGGMHRAARPGGDDLPFVYSGTMVVQGRGIARVTATGWRTEFGKIGRALETVSPEATFLQRKSARMIRNLAFIGLSLCATAAILYATTRGDWINGLLVGIALAMALLPEEIPVILTVFLAIGAWRMSFKHVLTRQMPAVETLGSATVLCVDKTGTLTQNRMAVSHIHADGQHVNIAPDEDWQLPTRFHQLTRVALLASESDPFDPMEKAFKEFAGRQLPKDSRYQGWSLVHEYSIAPEMLAISHVWQAPAGNEVIVAAKGAPEAIIELCHMAPAQQGEILRAVEIMAGQGLRVMAIAQAGYDSSNWPVSQHEFTFELLGLIGLADPIRPQVPAAIEECHRAGIRVVMITGDYPATAVAIARHIGLNTDGQVLTGNEIMALPAADLRARLSQTSIFARVLPEQKLTIVQAFKANGAIVAMTGDGVNDAPALKAAHIGIAMGARGTDVAREAASLVLLDDNFATMVHAIRAGRRIFDNLQKALAFVFSVHVPIAGLALIPLIFDLPLLLTPVHIVFLELIIDPACSIAFEAEPEEADIMQRPPRNPAAPLFAGRDIVRAVLQGAVSLSTVLMVFALSLYRGAAYPAVRAASFAALILSIVALIWINRSSSSALLQVLRIPNRAFWWVVAGAIGFLSLSLYLPLLRSVFRFAPLQPGDLAMATAAGLLTLCIAHSLKR